MGGYGDEKNYLRTEKGFRLCQTLLRNSSVKFGTIHLDLSWFSVNE